MSGKATYQALGRALFGEDNGSGIFDTQSTKSALGDGYNPSMTILVIMAKLSRSVFFAGLVLLISSSVSAQDETNSRPANPAELLAAVDRADKIVVYNYNVGADDRNRKSLYSSSERKDIQEFKQALIIEPPKEWFRCACLPMLEIELYRQGKQTGLVSLFEALTLGFSGWSGDVRIADQEKLLRWFDARGVTRPRKAVEAQNANERADAIAEQRWLDGMPPSLRPLWPGILKNPLWWHMPADAPKASARVLDPALANEYPNVNQRIRALFSWFGSGAGPWSGYYEWEDVASRMLLEYSAAELAAALQEEPLTGAQAEGAARFFVGYTPGASVRDRDDRTLIAQLPASLKQQLLEHVASTGDREKVESVRRAFQIPAN